MKLLVSIFIFFIVTYICFDLIFDLSNKLDIYVNKLPSDWTGGLLIYLILAIDILIPAPSSIIMVTSGALFGGITGGLIAILGSIT
ncbi:MAG: hypothetical protein ABIF17_03760, partial [Patescibacteria group bacterium]